MKTLLSSLFVTAAVIAPAFAHADVDVVVGFAPPALPVYVQPPVPGDGYMWTPGYWAWNGDDYYWVPGTWVVAPFAGALWTPGYWGAFNDGFAWHGGYWGDHVGFYGGINYGFGYCGNGYQGGYWNNGRFNYNRTVNNFGNTNITNIYSANVVNNRNFSRVSYNGGLGGVRMQPTRGEFGNVNSPRMGPTLMQRRHEQMASQAPLQRASFNGGSPRVAASAAPGLFNGVSTPGERNVQPRSYNNAFNYASQGRQTIVQHPSLSQSQPLNMRSSWYGAQQNTRQQSGQQTGPTGYWPQQHWGQQSTMRQASPSYAFRGSAPQQAAYAQPYGHQQSYAPQRQATASYGHVSYSGHR